MKNILIIAKIQLFKNEVSQNRVNFLKFLDTKSNIKVIEDLPRHINKSIQRLESNNFKPDCIIYYALSSHEQWQNIKIKGLEKTKLETYLFFEDFHYSTIAYNLYTTYKFNHIIIPTESKSIMKDYYKLDLKPIIWGFFVDTNIFKKYPNFTKKYDILFYGAIIPSIYPLRYKIWFYLHKIKEKYPNARIKIIDHPGYYKGISPNTPKGKDLSILLNQSKFSIATSSTAQLLVKKYLEIPLSNCCLAGNIPNEYQELLENNILDISMDTADDDILKKLIDILNGKYDYLIRQKRMKQFANKLKKQYSFEVGYIKLLEVINNSLTVDTTDSSARIANHNTIM